MAVSQSNADGSDACGIRPYLGLWALRFDLSRNSRICVEQTLKVQSPKIIFAGATLPVARASVKIARRLLVVLIDQAPRMDVQIPVRFSVKKRFSLALVALITLSLAIPIFVVAQQKPTQQGSSAGRTPSRTEPVNPGTARRPRVRGSEAITMVSNDFKEALAIIQDKYVDGNKLNYNDVYKSSMIGMLRVLDPHSNYFDREEFDELKTDQRSENSAMEIVREIGRA